MGVAGIPPIAANERTAILAETGDACNDTLHQGGSRLPNARIKENRALRLQRSVVQ